MESETQKVTRWVEEVLEKRNYDKFDFEFPGYDTSGGYAAEVVFVDVNAEKNGIREKLELIVKKNKETAAALEVLNLKLAYESETRVYGEVVPIFNRLAKEKNSEVFNDIPPCYGTICRENEYIIIMENLKSKGYKTHNLEIPMDLNHVKLVLEAYAKWHAFSLALKGKQREILETFEESSRWMLEGKCYEYMIKSMDNQLDWLIQEYKLRNKPKHIEKILLLKKNNPDLFANSLTYKNQECFVLRHGDSWNNNFLFHYASNGIPDQAVVIDWQVGILGSPSVDLANFIFMNCSRKELEHLDDLLEFYHGNLSRKLRELGGDPELSFPWDKFIESFRNFAPVGVAMMPMAVKMSYKVETGEDYDIAESIKDGDFTGVLGTEIRDAEGCFERMNGIIEYCIEYNYL